MIVYLNGNLVPEEQATVSIFDRGFLYGDGLFETLRIFNGRPFRWDLHVARLQKGAAHLGLRLPFPPESLRAAITELVRLNSLPDALLRLTVSRGCGPRGYSPRGADHPTVTMSLHPAPQIDPAVCPQWKLIVSDVRLPSQELLALFKTCSKLPQILARAQADAAGADEALLTNTDGLIAEASSANLFWIHGQTVCTTPLSGGVLAGVTREVVTEVCRQLSLPTQETGITRAQLLETDGVFLSLSSVGIAAGLSLDGRPLRQSPLIQRLRTEYQRVLQKESCPTASRCQTNP